MYHVSFFLKGKIIKQFKLCDQLEALGQAEFHRKNKRNNFQNEYDKTGN